MDNVIYIMLTESNRCCYKDYGSTYTIEILVYNHILPLLIIVSILITTVKIVNIAQTLLNVSSMIFLLLFVIIHM